MKQQVLVGAWITLSAIGCELATEFDRSKIDRDASVDATDDSVRGQVTADGSTFSVPGITNRDEPVLGGTAEERLMYGLCKLSDDARRPGYPFSVFAGHEIMTTPCQHEARIRHIPNRAWDTDCAPIATPERIGSITTGTILEIVRDCPDCDISVNPTCHGSHDRDCGGGYGNYVTVLGDDGIRYRICHFMYRSIPASLEIGCRIRIGDYLGFCGNSGASDPTGSDGSHAHVDASRTNEAGELVNVDLDDPNTWSPVATLANASCGRDPENCANGVDDNDDGRVDCEDASCVTNPVCTPHISLVSCSSTRRGDLGVVCDVYGDHFIAPLDHVWVGRATLVARTFVNSGHFRLTLNWNCSATLGPIAVYYRHAGAPSGDCGAVYKACLEDAAVLTDDCTGVACANSACERWCDAGCAEEDPCAGVACDMPPPFACVNASTRRVYAVPGSCTDGVCSYTAVNQSCDDANPCTQNVCSGAGVCSWPLVANTCGARACGSSPDGCYACGTCPARTNTTSSCDAGTCRYACRVGYSDCDRSMANGCETYVSNNPRNCGSCGYACPNVSPHAYESCTSGICTMGACVSHYANCDGNAANGCEVHISADTRNCGSCGNICPVPPHMVPTCVTGSCERLCQAGWFDCDGNRNNGCEHSGECMAPDPCAGVVCNDDNACTSDSCVAGSCRHDPIGPDCGARVCGAAPNGCGWCGTCPILPHASVVCVSGSCQINSCSGNYRDCDGVPGNGCEQFIGNDVNNCGACGNVCPAPPHMVPTCVVGRCGRLCAAGWENCDGNPENGCEHSGPCAVCGPELCDGADNDCNGIADDGDNGCGGVCPLADLGLPCDGPDADRCTEGVFICLGLNDTVCNDASGDSVEICGNAADEDCDGVINDPDVCPPPGPSCPNDICDMDESDCSCPADCDARCGDGCCTGGETCGSCEPDCGACPPPPGVCNNDGSCNNGETCGTCPCDCCRACDPGEVASQACDPTPGVVDLCSFVQSHTCTASCAWGAWGECGGREDQPQYRFDTERQCGPAYPPTGVQICAQITGLNRICLGGAHCIDGRITKSDGSDFGTSAVVTVWSDRGPHEIARRTCWPLSGNWIPFPNGAEIEELELGSPGSIRDVFIWIESYAGSCAAPGEAAYYRSGYVTVQRCRR